MVFGALLAFSPLPPPAPLQLLGPRRIDSRKVWSIRVKGRDDDLGVQEQRVVFSEGVKEWGVGSGPIFTVDRNSEDGRLRVSVDEEEIVVRSGFQSMVSRRPCDSSERISKARRIAEEIEQGKLLPPESDPMFRFVGREELQQPVNFVMSSPPVHVSSTRSDLVATNFVGLIGGIGVAVTSFLVNRWKEMEKEKPGEEKKKKKEKVASDGNPDDDDDDEEKKLTKIRSMAREVELGEAARKKDDEKAVPEPLRYAAAARAELVKKQQKARRGEAKESEVITLARRLGEVRRLGDGELLPGKVPGMLVNGVEIPVASENSLNGSPKVHEEDQSSSPQARVDDETGAVSRGTMPRIITSYEEACEVLASRNLKSKKLTDARTSEDHKLVPDELKLEKDSSEDPKLAKTEEVVKVEESSSTGSGEQDGWLRDDVLEILIRTRKNDLEGKDYFHGLPPDAKEILFKGLDEDLGEDEAEQFKAWVNQKTAANALKAAAPPSEANPVLKPPRPRALGAKPGAAASNKKKVWPKEFQRRYERETSPKMRKLMRDIGKNLDRWVPEEVLDADLKLFQQGPEGMRELLRRWITALKEEARQKGKPVGDIDEELSRYDKLQKRMEKHEALFGKQDLANKMADYKPRKKDTLWWLDLRYVACIMVKNDDQKMNPGLYSMNMAIDEEKETKMHVVAFEEQNDARNFCRLLVPELDKEGGSTGVAVIPFEPKELLNEVRSTEFEVTVVKKGQVELYAGKPLEEAEARIYEIGRDVYVQERLRERSCDINAALKEFERDL